MLEGKRPGSSTLYKRHPSVLKIAQLSKHNVRRNIRLYSVTHRLWTQKTTRAVTSGGEEASEGVAFRSQSLAKQVVLPCLRQGPKRRRPRSESNATGTQVQFPRRLGLNFEPISVHRSSASLVIPRPIMVP